MNEGITISKFIHPTNTTKKKKKKKNRKKEKVRDKPLINSQVSINELPIASAKPRPRLVSNLPFVCITSTNGASLLCK